MAINNAVTNIAGVVSAITTTISYTDTTVTVGTIPANAQIINIHIDVLTSFNAGTTNTLAVGYTGGSTGAYVTPITAAVTGRLGNSTAVLSAWDPLTPADTEVTATATFAQTGTAASAGSARVTVLYKSFSGDNN